MGSNLRLDGKGISPKAAMRKIKKDNKQNEKCMKCKRKCCPNGHYKYKGEIVFMECTVCKKRTNYVVQELGALKCSICKGVRKE